MKNLIELIDISKLFGSKPDLAASIAIHLKLAKPAPIVHAVDHVNLAIKEGEVLGMVGESGCGKSTLGRITAGINEQTYGEVIWHGKNRLSMTHHEKQTAALDTQMIFQNSMSSLNPRMTIDKIVAEAALCHGLIHGDKNDYVDKYLTMAGFDPLMKHRYPHQFSGGQRQRINIARALAVQPKFLVCDESVAALDVSIQAQIINLFMELREKLRLTYLFISHDLGVVEHISDRVAIMYLGRLVELAPVEEIFHHSAHPYTRALLDEIPKIELTKRQFTSIKGELPSPLNPPKGCHFHTRCPFATKQCSEIAPPLKEIAPNHYAACHLNN